jgi:hypothetical protein
MPTAFNSAAYAETVSNCGELTTIAEGSSGSSCRSRPSIALSIACSMVDATTAPRRSTTTARASSCISIAAMEAHKMRRLFSVTISRAPTINSSPWRRDRTENCCATVDMLAPIVGVRLPKARAKRHVDCLLTRIHPNRLSACVAHGLSHPSNRGVAAAALVTLLAGCATPGTPGTGTGAEYTPVIDTAGADMSTYERDIAACRQLARNVDANRAGWEGLAAGGLAGALAAGIFGASRTQANQAVTAGMLGGSANAQNDAFRMQKTMVINCMAGRGYRTLEGGNYVPRAPTTAVAPPAATPQQAAPMVLSAPAPPLVAVLAPAPGVSTKVELGRESYQVERMDEAKACNPQPIAKLTGKGPGVETYAVACASGDVLAVRCEFGNCRVLK